VSAEGLRALRRGCAELRAAYGELLAERAHLAAAPQVRAAQNPRGTVQNRAATVLSCSNNSPQELAYLAARAEEVLTQKSEPGQVEPCTAPLFAIIRSPLRRCNILRG
jgi:hypothetical protein